MSILVTGAAGFVGSHIAEALAANGRDEDRMVADAVGRNRRVLDCGCAGGRIARQLVAQSCFEFGEQSANLTDGLRARKPAAPGGSP